MDLSKKIFNCLKNNLNLLSFGILFAFIILIITSAYALTAQEVFKKVNQSIVALASPKDDKGHLYISQGGGVAVTPTILVTNCHVALAGNTLFAKVNNDLLVARVVYKNSDHDLCIVEVPSGKFAPVNIRNSTEVEIGEVVYAIGNPEGLEKTLTQGIISGKRDYKGGVWLQTDATISHGSSGGGLFDMQGNLIGITTAKLADVNIGFAIPTEWVKTALAGPRITESEESTTMASADEGKSKGKGTKKGQADKGKSDKGQAQDGQAGTQAGAQTGKQAGPKTGAQTGNAGTQASSEIYEYPKIVDLGQFGENRISLYKIKEECLIAIPGIDANGKIVSYAVWLRSSPDALMLFPNAPTPYVAFQQLEEFANNPKYQKKLQLSKNYIFLADMVQELVGTNSIKGTYAMHIALFNSNISNFLLEGTKFVVQYRNVNKKYGFMVVEYGLSGFSAAMATLQTLCVQK